MARDKWPPVASGEETARANNRETATMACRWIITLVHGTWGRGFLRLDRPSKLPRWFEEDSRFLKHLHWRLRDAEISDATIEVCKWSGANSIVAREKGARQLADQLIAQRSADPDARQIVVAHSHGGNLAIRSLEHMQDRTEGLLLLTLATPFLEMFPPEREHFPLDRIVFFSAGALLLWIGSIVFAGLMLPPLAVTFAIVAIPLLANVIGVIEFRKHQARKKQIVPDSYVDRLARMTSHDAETGATRTVIR